MNAGFQITDGCGLRTALKSLTTLWPGWRTLDRAVACQL